MPGPSLGSGEAPQTCWADLGDQMGKLCSPRAPTPLLLIWRSKEEFVWKNRVLPLQNGCLRRTVPVAYKGLPSLPLRIAASQQGGGYPRRRHAHLD